MIWFCCQFFIGVGVLVVVSGIVGCVVVKMLNINGVCYGMVYDELLCIGCIVCMDVCWEVNKVLEGVLCLMIICSELQGEFFDVKYCFFCKFCQYCDYVLCVDVCLIGVFFCDVVSGIVDVNSDFCVGCQYCIVVCLYCVCFIYLVMKMVDKCDFCCKINLQVGKLFVCVEVCLIKVLMFGNLDDFNSEIL